MALATELLDVMWDAVGGEPSATRRVTFTGDQSVPAAFAATDFASAAIATAGLAVADLLRHAGRADPGVTVDRTLASAWFAQSLRPEGWSLPPVWDRMAGDYETSDGWVRLHTNAPRHRAAALAVVGGPPEREAVAVALRRWNSVELETAIVESGGCAAAMHSVEEWSAHPQGRSVAGEPLVDRLSTGPGDDHGWRPSPNRPLAGVRVLDLTRVLAGPVATRLLAGLGADVLRIDPPDWDETIAPEVTLGKRCARLDAGSTSGREQLAALLAGADVLVHGFRPGALDRLGLSEQERAAVRPGLVDVSLDAYGWTGPWSGRRGFDSLVQMSCGIADHGRTRTGSTEPSPLPFQALDQATGYLMAAAAIRGLAVRMTHGTGWRARCALARTAHLLVGRAKVEVSEEVLDLSSVQTAPELEETPWGPARRVVAPVAVDGAPLRWDRPATVLGSDSPSW